MWGEQDGGSMRHARGVVEFRVLGTLEVRADGEPIPLGPPKQRAVLAILLLQAGQIVPTDRLIELIWGERPPRTAAHSVQIYVSELRKALERQAGTQAIATRPPGYVLEVDPEEIDARRYERLLARGARDLEAGHPASAVAAANTPYSSTACIDAGSPSLKSRQLRRHSIWNGSSKSPLEFRRSAITIARNRNAAM